MTADLSKRYLIVILRSWGSTRYNQIRENPKFIFDLLEVMHLTVFLVTKDKGQKDIKT